MQPASQLEIHSITTQAGQPLTPIRPCVDGAFSPPISHWTAESCLSFLSPSDTRQRKFCGSLKLADVKQAVIERLQTLTSQNPTSLLLSQTDIYIIAEIINIQHMVGMRDAPHWKPRPLVQSVEPLAFLRNIRLIYKTLSAWLAQSLPSKENITNSAPHLTSEPQSNVNHKSPSQ